MLAAAPAVAGPKALFDNAHAETAGNADWQIDTHQPVPSPDQSGIGPNTPGTFWIGAISSWGVDLVKRGYTVATNTAPLTYQNLSNPYDLSKYDVLIVDEPNTLFTSAEASAILSFVHDGGGLVAVSDHYGSDRNSDGFDAPMIWNALDPSHLLGVHCGVSGDPNNNIVQTSTNVNPAASDSVTRGPVGNVTGLAFHNGTTFTLFPGANPTVRGEVWMTGLPQSSLTGLMAASSAYGSGRFFITGDSSPADDGSAAPGNSSIFDGWGEAGATDSTLFLNATLWASRRAASGDVTAPVVTVTAPAGGETWKAGSTHTVTWTATDNVGVTTVDVEYSIDGGGTYPYWIAIGIPNSGSTSWTVPNTASPTARVRVKAHDAAGNTGVGISGSFTIDAWIITASSGTGGTIDPEGPIEVAQGAEQDFTITPDSGQHVRDVVVDGSSVGAVTSYAFTSVAADHTIDASFEADVTGVESGPAVLALAPPAPNPGHGAALLRFSLPAQAWVALEILDLSGRRVARLAADLSPGEHAWRWEGNAADGTRAGAGLYFVRLVTPWGTRTRRLAWLR